MSVLKLTAALAAVVGFSSAALAAPPPTLIPLPDHADSLIVPAGSGLSATTIGKVDDVHFHGRFTLTGEYHFGCEIECDAPGQGDERFLFYVTPDPAQAALLPHWKERAGALRIVIGKRDALLHRLVSSAEMARLRAGTVQEISGRTSIVVENYVAALECDSAIYSADFVALAAPVKGAATHKGSYGCA